MSERKTTRFAVLEAERVVKVHEREIPALKADEVLIKNGACNICTTDYGQYTGARKNLMFPMAWGHEFAGTIVDMGSDVKEFPLVWDDVIGKKLQKENEVFNAIEFLDKPVIAAM